MTAFAVLKATCISLSSQPVCLMLILQNNSISSLKGSLQRFHFLETLDVSNNQLRNLAKLAAALSKCRFLSFLNLKVCSTLDLFVAFVQVHCNTSPVVVMLTDTPCGLHKAVLSLLCEWAGIGYTQAGHARHAGIVVRPIT